jgi:hypothetical protein
MFSCYCCVSLIRYIIIIFSNKQRSTNTNNFYPLDRAKKLSQKSTSIRKGGRNEPGACFEN